MFAVNGGDDGHYGSEKEEGAVTLIRFDDHVFAAPEPGGCACMIHAAAHDECRVQAGGAQNGGDHGGAGRFAVRAGHGDAIFQAHQFSQHLGARNDRNFRARGFQEFGIVAANGGTGDHHMSALNLLGTMALVDQRAEVGQPVGDRREPRIRTGYGISQGEQYLGDAAHANTADTDQMNAFEIVKRAGHGRATSSIKSTIFSAACGRASSRARVPSSTSPAG